MKRREKTPPRTARAGAGGTPVVGLLFAFVLSALIGSCSRSEPNASDPSRGEKTVEALAIPATPVVVDFEGLKKRVSSLRGKVVLLDFWATYCGPCVKALPHLSALQKRFGPKGLLVLAVNRDFPRDWPQAKRILESKGVNFPCVVLENGSSDAVVAWLGRKWRSELPARFLIDREGKVVGEFLGDAEEKEIEEAVASLVERNS